jgi:hypothetical protein
VSEEKRLKTDKLQLKAITTQYQKLDRPNYWACWFNKPKKKKEEPLLQISQALVTAGAANKNKRKKLLLNQANANS